MIRNPDSTLGSSFRPVQPVCMARGVAMGAVHILIVMKFSFLVNLYSTLE